ncbi:MAG TPA: dihydrolipoamide acetyltransferase family protein [Patescibacteria group bacterium]|nr:dihydrolipoamide acetyltransferase family protein [Patescibacteria group bacterium]
MAKVTMPQLGESVAEGTIGRWLKNVGDHVEKYESIVEVVTDKVNAEVPSPFAGTLTAILVEEGATVPNETPIAEIETADVAESPAGPAGPAVAATIAVPASAPVPPPAPKRSDPGPVPAVSGAAAHSAVADPDARMTPAVRRLLREHGLVPEQIRGTGGGGRITREDVTATVEAIRTGAVPAAPAPSATPVPTPPAPISAAPGAAFAFPPGADEALVPLTQMRKAIAAQMTRALLVPHAYVHVEVDVANLVRLRESLKRDYQAREGISLSFVPFVVKAAVEALRRHPTFNATWTEQGLVAKRRVNVGVAVAVDDGLIVPVIRDVDQLSVNGLNRAIADVAARARTKKLRLDDFGGGTFTIDNTGWFGSNLTMPIINVPEVAILTMEAITKRPVVVETPQGDVIAIRPIMNMVIGIDHRANDGAQAGFFLRDVKAWLEGIGPDTAIH